MKKWIVFFGVALLCAGCQRQAATPALAASVAVASAVAPTITPVKVSTPGEWTQTLEGLYQPKDVHDDGNGVTHFFAVFGKSKSPGVIVANGTRDAFRKLRIYELNVVSADRFTELSPYVAVLDNKMPNLLLQADFWSRHKWLFLAHVAVMVDGELVIDRDIPYAGLSRHSDLSGVSERTDFLVRPEELNGLKKISKTSEIIIRFTGKNGYVTVEPFLADNFRVSAMNGVRLYEKMSAALAGHIPPA